MNKKIRLHVAAAVVWASVVTAFAGEPREISIAAGDLAPALESLAKESGLLLIFRPDDLRGVRTQGVNGKLSPEEAVARLLDGTSLTMKVDAAGAILIAPANIRTSTATDMGGVRLAQAIDVAAEEVGTGARSEEGPSGTVDEVVVTGVRFYQINDSSAATKLELPLLETPQSVSVVNADLIKAFGITDLKYLSRYVSGLESKAEAIGETSSFSARGFSMDLADGYKLNGMSFMPIQPIDPVAIERVEFLKGPSGVVYGRNNYGGMLNYITKQPESRDFVNVGVTFGYPQISRVEADINSTLVDDVLAFRVPMAYEYHDNYSDEGSRQLTVVPSLRWKPSESVTVDVLGIAQQWRVNRQVGLTAWMPDKSAEELDWTIGGGSDCTETRCLAPPSFLRDTFFGSDRDFFDSTTIQVAAQLRWQVNDHLSYFIGGNYLSSDGDTEQYYLQLPLAADGVSRLYGDAIRSKEKSSSFEMGLTGDFRLFGRTHKFYVGGDYRDYRKDLLDSYGIPLSDPIDVFSFNKRNSFRNYLRESGLDQMRIPFDYSGLTDRKDLGLGAQVVLELADPLTLLVGGRYEDSTLDQTYTSLEPGVFDFTDTFSAKHFMPRAGLTWKFVPGKWAAYLSYTEGYVPQSGITRSGEKIAPEEGYQIEAGVKAQLFEDRLLLTLAAFDIKRRNVSVSDPRNIPGDIFVVGGLTQNNRGLEFEAVGRVTPALNVILVASTIRAKYGESTDDYLGGKEVGSTPEYKISGYFNYEFDYGAPSGFSLGGGFTTVGPQWGHNPQSWPLPRYTTADLSAGYRFNPKTRVSLQVQNLFDETYFVSAGFWSCCGVFGNERSYRATVDMSF